MQGKAGSLMNCLTDFFKGQRSYRTLVVLGLATIILIFFVIVNKPLDVLSRAGGGGGGGGGGSGGTGEGDVIIALVALMGLGAYYLYQLYLRMQKIWLVNSALKILERQDPIWRKQKLIRFVKNLFILFQRAWSNKDRDTLKMLMTESLFGEWAELLDKMDEMGQRNVLQGLRVASVNIIDVRDYKNDDLDTFSAEISAIAVDYTVDNKGQWTIPKWKKNLDSNMLRLPKPFIEVWNFIRSENTWILKHVDQATQRSRSVGRNILIDGQKFESGE